LRYMSLETGVEWKIQRGKVFLPTARLASVQVRSQFYISQRRLHLRFKNAMLLIC